MGVVPGAKPDGASTLGAPRPQTAEDAQIWAGLPVGWSGEGDTSPDAIVAPVKPAAPVAAAPVAASPPPSVPVPVPAPFLSRPVAVPPPAAVAKPPARAPELQLDTAAAGSRLELATPKKAETKDWERKWQRAELDAKRTRRSSGGGRVVLYLFGFVVVLVAASAIAAQVLGLLATPAREATPAPASTTAVAAATPTPEPTATAPILPPPTLPPVVSREQRLARADVLAARGKTADAIREYDALLEFEPELAEVHFRQASLHAKLKNYGKACVAYRRYLEIEPEGKHAKEANAGAVRCR